MKDSWVVSKLCCEVKTGITFDAPQHLLHVQRLDVDSCTDSHALACCSGAFIYHLRLDCQLQNGRTSTFCKVYILQ